MPHFYLKVVRVTICLLGSYSGAIAQTAPASGPRKVTVYLTAAGTQLPSSDGADHRAEITMRDSVSGMMREYFPSGKLWRIIPFAHVRLGIRHGVEMNYDEAGKLRRRQEFLGGQRQGEVQLFDVSGTLSRTIIYDKDKRVSQQCFSSTGQLKGCQEDKQVPQYPGGMNGLVKAIERAAVLPAEDVANQGFGKVLLKLVVDAHANIIGATVANAPTANMGKAVLDAVKRIPAFQAPAMVDQESVSALITLLIKIGAPVGGWDMSHAYTEAPPKVTYLDAE